MFGLPKCTRHQGRTHHGLFADGEGDGDPGEQHLQLVCLGGTAVWCRETVCTATSLVCCGGVG